MAKRVSGKPKDGRGGARKGAGRPKGPSKTTLEKVAAREFVRAYVTDRLTPLLEAQVAHAVGLKYLVARDKKTGKFTRLSQEEAEKALAQGDESAFQVIEVWEKDPSVQAFTDLLNRALDKPKEQEMEVKVTGDDALIARLMAARKRVCADA